MRRMIDTVDMSLQQLQEKNELVQHWDLMVTASMHDALPTRTSNAYERERGLAVDQSAFKAWLTTRACCLLVTEQAQSHRKASETAATKQGHDHDRKPVLCRWLQNVSQTK